MDNIIFILATCLRHPSTVKEKVFVYFIFLPLLSLVMKLLKEGKNLKQLLHYKDVKFSCSVLRSLTEIAPAPIVLRWNLVGKSSRVFSTFSFYIFSALNLSHYCMPKAKYKLHSTGLSLLSSPDFHCFAIIAVCRARLAYSKTEDEEEKLKTRDAKKLKA